MILLELPPTRANPRGLGSYPAFFFLALPRAALATASLCWLGALVKQRYILPVMCRRQTQPCAMAVRKEVQRILAAPAPRPWWNQHFTWTAEDDEKLKILADAAADLDRSARP